MGWWLLISGVPIVSADEASFFVVWGLKGGGFHGELTVEKGEIRNVDPWQWEPADELNIDKQRVSWVGNVYGGTDGLQITATGDAATTFRLRFTVPHKAEAQFAWRDVAQGGEHVVSLSEEHDFFAYGPGDIRRGPRTCRFVELPPLYRAPGVPTAGVVALLEDWFERPSPVTIRLSQAPAGELTARRMAANGGKLIVQVQAEQPLGGKAEVGLAGKRLASVDLNGALWLSLSPRIGTLQFQVEHPGGKVRLSVATTLVEVRGPKLFVNGEPFLVKGTLPRNLNDQDAAYLKSLGANTLRMRPGDQLPFLERHGFMVIASSHSGPGRLCEKAETEEAFHEAVMTYLQNSLERARQVVNHPHTLIVQLGNEQVMGQDPWLSRFRPPHSFDRLDYLLTRLYNQTRPLCPMLPLGYANCAFGYVAPDFLDVYLHNTYLDKDRNWPPIEEFMALQGCDERPYIHTEYGANVYMPQAYLRGPNSPVLEKIHAWNYPNRWNTYQAAGACGATNYCLYDYDYSKVNRSAWDKGLTNFGIMTFDRKPKLACWELWHLWRDFEVEPEGEDKLRVRWKREYWARGCRLVYGTNRTNRTYPLDDFAPNSERVVQAPSAGQSFRWRIDYTTHGGLPMQATGACPQSLEAEDFLKRLQDRDTYPFLRELFDAEVVTVEGKPAPPTLKEMEREDGVVPVAFRKPNGVVYLTALTRKKPKRGWYAEGVDLEVAFAGTCVAVDELSGEPAGAAAEGQPTAKGLRLRHVRVPYMPSPYGQRATEPLSLPVFRITP